MFKAYVLLHDSDPTGLLGLPIWASAAPTTVKAGCTWKPWDIPPPPENKSAKRRPPLPGGEDSERTAAMLFGGSPVAGDAPIVSAVDVEQLDEFIDLTDLFATAVVCGSSGGGQPLMDG